MGPIPVTVSCWKRILCTFISAISGAALVVCSRRGTSSSVQGWHRCSQLQQVETCSFVCVCWWTDPLQGGFSHHCWDGVRKLAWLSHIFPWHLPWGRAQSRSFGSRIPVMQNVGERKSNYRPCPFVYFQRRLLKIKTVDFFLISAAHIQEFLWPDTQCRQATWLKTDIFNHHLQGTGCTLRLAVFLSPMLRSLKARVLFWLFTGCRELIFWFAFKCVWLGSTEQQLKGRKQSKADS